jgi:hypothetical protein
MEMTSEEWEETALAVADLKATRLGPNVTAW